MENRLNSCEVNVDHNDECANNNNNNDNDDNNNNKGMDFQKMVILRTAHVFRRHATIHLNTFGLCTRVSPSLTVQLSATAPTGLAVRKCPVRIANTAKSFTSVINQLDAQNFCFTISLFHASTCFEHMCSSSGGQNCITQPLVSSHL